VLFALGSTPEPLPSDLDTQGAGGVETTYLELPPVLADLGFDVFVAGRCEEQQRGRAYYLPHADLPAAHLQPDIVVATRWFEPFTWYPNAKHILWLQDAWFADCLPILQAAHATVVSSPWHRNYTLQRYPFRGAGSGHAIDPAKLHVIPLGIHLHRFLSLKKCQVSSVTCHVAPPHMTHDTSTLDTSAHDTPRAIYSSNPDRGLVELAQMWPALRAAVPDLTLTVTYGWEGLATWDASPEWRAHIKRTRAAIEETMTPLTGVTFTGRLGKRRLVEEMQRASILLYPNNFQETFCLTVLEAQAAGVPVLSSQLGALPTTVHPDAGILIPGHPSAPDYQARFVAAAADLLHDPVRRARMAQAGIAHASQHDWTAIAEQWRRLIWRLR
jgi:glycosyltransferase involved in cell wall biosynthesis